MASVIWLPLLCSTPRSQARQQAWQGASQDLGDVAFAGSCQAASVLVTSPPSCCFNRSTIFIIPAYKKNGRPILNTIVTDFGLYVSDWDSVGLIRGPMGHPAFRLFSSVPTPRKHYRSRYLFNGLQLGTSLKDSLEYACRKASPPLNFCVFRFEKSFRACPRRGMRRPFFRKEIASCGDPKTYVAKRGSVDQKVVRRRCLRLRSR